VEDAGPDNRCQICIGTDDFHSPSWLVEFLTTAFATRGFDVDVNRPFSGTFVPMDFYRRNPQVFAVMIEVNRCLYLDETNGQRRPGFARLQSELRQVFAELALDGVLVNGNLLSEGQVLGGQTEPGDQERSDQKIDCLDDAHGEVSEVVGRLRFYSREAWASNLATP
jgi:hypothetical protein